MAKICAIGERKIVLGVLCEKQKATALCLGCYASGPCHCKLTGDMDTAVEDGGRECESDGECTIWRKTAEATPALIAAAWARQAVATLPELPESLTGPTVELAKLAKAGVELILNKLINELEVSK